MDRDENKFTPRGALFAGLLIVVAAALAMSLMGGKDAPAKAAAPQQVASASTAPAASTPADSTELPTTPMPTTATPTPPAGTRPGAVNGSATAPTTPDVSSESPSTLQVELPEPPPAKVSTTDLEARQNALVVVSQVEACHVSGLAYGQCTEQRSLGSTVPISDTPGAGEVSVVAVANGYVVSAVDILHRQWRISKRATSFTRTCHLANGVAPCQTPTW